MEKQERGKIILKNMDCMEAMAGMRDNQFDLSIVDPPYGINHSKKTKYHSGAFTEYKKKKWDEKIPDKKYFNELFRVSKNQIIWGANYFVKYLPPAKNWIVWDKKQPENVSFSMYELAYYNGIGQAKIFRHYSGGNRCTNELKAVKYIKIHSAQKPVALYRWLLENYAKKDDKILDTHGGSMSLAIACYDLKFDLTCFEIDKDYYDSAVKRFNEHKQQLQLY